MEGPSGVQAGPDSAALRTPPRDREETPNSGCAASSPHQAGATGTSDASPGISCQTVRPKLPKKPLRREEADSGVGHQNASLHPPLDSAPPSSGSESPAAAPGSEIPSGGSFRGFGGAPPDSEEDEGGEDDNAPDDPPPLPPRSKLRKAFSLRSIVQSVQGILHLEGRGAGEGRTDFPHPLTPHSSRRLLPSSLPKSNSSRGSRECPNPWIPLKQLSRGDPLPKTEGGVPAGAVPGESGGAPGDVLGRRTPETASGEAEVSPPGPSRQQRRSPEVVPAPRGLEVPAEPLGCNTASQASRRSQGKHLCDPDSSAGLGAGALGGFPVPQSRLGEPSGHPLAAFPWFHGNLSRLRAAQLVGKRGVRDHGLFLVRRSETRRGCYVLTLNCYGNAKHVLVHLDEDGRCSVRSLLFASIFDMLDYFRVHPIPFNSKVTCCATLSTYVEDLHRFSGRPSTLGSHEQDQCQAQAADRDFAWRPASRDFGASHLGSPRSRRRFQMPLQEFPGAFRGREEAGRASLLGASEDYGGACGGEPPDATPLDLSP